jgi:hypothetical protein
MLHKFQIFGVVTVATSGVRQRFTTDESIIVSAVYVESDNLNTGYTFVGDSSVTTANGAQLNGVTGITIDGSMFGHPHGTKFMLADLYADTASNGNKLRVFIAKERGA